MLQTDVKLSTMSYVIIYVKDINKAKAFYRDTLGMKIKVDEDGWVELETGLTTLALHHAEDMPAKREKGQAIVVFNVEDITGAYDALKKKGIKFEKEPQIVCEAGDKVGKSADFKDPDGNCLSIFAYVKK